MLKKTHHCFVQLSIASQMIFNKIKYYQYYWYRTFIHKAVVKQSGDDVDCLFNARIACCIYKLALPHDGSEEMLQYPASSSFGISKIIIILMGIRKAVTQTMCRLVSRESEFALNYHGHDSQVWKCYDRTLCWFDLTFNSVHCTARCWIVDSQSCLPVCVTQGFLMCDNALTWCSPKL